jgi:hypothetical protein
MATLRLFCLTAGIERSPLFRYAISRDAHFSVQRTAVTINFLLLTTFKEGVGNGFSYARTQVPRVTNTLLHVEVLLVKLKILYSEYFLLLRGLFLHTLSFNMPRQ